MLGAKVACAGVLIFAQTSSSLVLANKDKELAAEPKRTNKSEAPTANFSLLTLSAETARPKGGTFLSVAKGPKRTRLSRRVRLNLNQLSNDFGRGLERLSDGALHMRFDLMKKRARFGLGGGDPETMRFRFDSEIEFSAGRALVRGRLELAMAGQEFRFELPDFEVDNSSTLGKRGVEIRVPLLKTRF